MSWGRPPHKPRSTDSSNTSAVPLSDSATSPTTSPDPLPETGGVRPRLQPGLRRAQLRLLWSPVAQREIQGPHEVPDASPRRRRERVAREYVDQYRGRASACLLDHRAPDCRVAICSELGYACSTRSRTENVPDLGGSRDRVQVGGRSSVAGASCSQARHFGGCVLRSPVCVQCGDALESRPSRTADEFPGRIESSTRTSVLGNGFFEDRKHVLRTLRHVLRHHPQLVHGQLEIAEDTSRRLVSTHVPNRMPRETAPTRKGDPRKRVPSSKPKTPNNVGGLR